MATADPHSVHDDGIQASFEQAGSPDFITHKKPAPVDPSVHDDGNGLKDAVSGTYYPTNLSSGPSLRARARPRIYRSKRPQITSSIKLEGFRGRALSSCR